MCKERRFYGINYSIRDDILVDFLAAHRAEVEEMVLTEYNETRHMELVAVGVYAGKTEVSIIGGFVFVLMNGTNSIKKKDYSTKTVTSMRKLREISLYNEKQKFFH